MDEGRVVSLRLDEPFRWGGSRLTPHDGMAVPVKAATGLERYFNGDKPMLLDHSQRPAKMMRDAQALYASHPWIRRAESVVTSKVAGLPWHIEDEANEVDDETVSPQLQAVRDLLEKPQAALPVEDRQPGITTRRGLVSITSRHMGLCGLAYWFLDQMDQNNLPLAILSVNPARVTVRATESGNLVGYSLDADDWGNGGTFFRPDQLLPFFLEVPDNGSQAMGLVAAAALKARIVTAADVHSLSVLGTGGRIAGIVAPKDGYIDDPDKFAQMERDFRNVNEAPDAAKRLTILRGAMEFTKTAADPSELSLLDMSNTGRDDIFSVWGFPPSQAGVAQSRGLNSGESGSHEHEVLMTGPVHDRVVAISEVIQYDLLDRFTVLGINPQLVIEEPSFDDEKPVYDLALKAVGQPLTNNERRSIIGLDPLPDYGPTGDPLGVAILLPSLVTLWAQGAETGSTPTDPFANAPVAPEPVAPVAPDGVNIPAAQSAITQAVTLHAKHMNGTEPTSGTSQQKLMTLIQTADAALGAASPMAPPSKAGFLGLRSSVDQRTVPAISTALKTFLAAQRSDIASRIRRATARQLGDESYWFSDAWDGKLDKALRPHIAGIARTVTTRTAEMLATGKAKRTAPPEVVAAAAEVDLDPFIAEVERYVLAQTGTRIGGINATTRDAVGSIIRAGITEGLTASDLADRIEQMPAFDEARAELVARTESMFAYNSASLSSFGEFGVEEVQAIDGDYDAVCAERNGQIFSVAEAADIEDHPNGTLDWAPYFAKAEPMLVVAKAMMGVSASMAEMAQREPVAPIVNVSAPEVTVLPPNLTIEQGAVVVNLPEPRAVRKRIERDEHGAITGSVEEAV